MRPVAALCVSALSFVLAALPAAAQGISAQDIARAREDLGSRPRVSAISPACLKPDLLGQRIHVAGLNLGASPGGRRAVLTLAGHVLDSSVVSWANGQIEIEVRPFRSLAPAEAAPIGFEIRSEAGTAYPGSVRSLHVCRTRFEQTLAFDMGLCAFAGPTLPFDRTASGETHTLDAPAAGAGRYRYAMGYAIPFTVRPKPVSGCPEGRWEPGVRDVQPSDAAWQQTLFFRYVTPTRRVTVPAATITTFVRAALSDAAIHLNNYGPKVGKSYLKRGEAWIKLGPAGGGGTFPITIEEIRLDPPDPLGRILYYVHDVDSSRVAFTHDAGHYHLTVAFANTADGIKGEHEGAGISPSMAVNDATIAVTLHFAPGAGPKPDTLVDKVEFSVHVEGGCNVAVFNVCSLVTALLKNGLPERGVPGLEGRVKDALSDPGSRKAIGDAIWNGLDSPLGRLAISNAAGGTKVSRLVRVSAASADGLEVEFVPGT